MGTAEEKNTQLDKQMLEKSIKCKICSSAQHVAASER